MNLEEQENQPKTANEAASPTAELERKTTAELFAATLVGEYDDDSAWDAVGVLRMRGTLEVFELATRYCASQDPKERARGLSVLAQLGAGKSDADRPFIDDCVSTAIAHLRDSDEEAIRCAAWALSHLGTKQAVLSLIELKSHVDPEVRQAVACCIELRKHPEAVPILVALTDDTNEVVRDWATFALGTGDVEEGGNWRYPDSTEIREAFRRRLDDSYEEARREAIWGLARRRDPVGLKLLLNHPESEERWNGDTDAAEEVLGMRPETPLEELCAGLRQLLA
jgi:HEAT repeat protein